MTTRPDCRSCQHYRLTLPEPFSASDLRSPEVMEERMKWTEYVNRREQKEVDQVERGHTTFSYEPWFFSWCGHRSAPAPEVVQPRDLREGVYLLTDVVNKDGDCADFVAPAAGK